MLDPHSEEKRLSIEQAVAQKQTDHPVFCQDEFDIDLKCITTTGQNQKYYLADKLHWDTGRVHRADTHRKALNATKKIILKK